jgi:hypothetical protein
MCPFQASHILNFFEKLSLVARMPSAWPHGKRHKNDAEFCADGILSTSTDTVKAILRSNELSSSSPRFSVGLRPAAIGDNGRGKVFHSLGAEMNELTSGGIGRWLGRLGIAIPLIVVGGYFAAIVAAEGWMIWSGLSNDGTFHDSVVWLVSVAGGPPKGVADMCDYSLHNVTSRPAKVGDRLTTRNFGTGTRGFAASEDDRVAVCVLPGTELAFAKTVEYGPAGLLGWIQKTAEYRTAIFRQINKDRPAAHHDALELPDGKVALLTRLKEGQEAVVLQLPTRVNNAWDAETERRVAYVG